MIKTAICKVCGEKFKYEHKGGRPRVTCDKKTCKIKNHQLRSREYAQNHKEERKEYYKKYNETHREEINQKQKRYDQRRRKKYQNMGVTTKLVEKHIAPPPKETVNEIVKKALAKHMSYGEYMTWVNERGH